jgi:hypothetical protein
MDLSLATTEQIIEELKGRPLEFALILTPENAADHPEEAVYEIHSSMTDSSEENSLQEAAYCLMASSSLLEHLAHKLDEAEDAKAEDLWRWRAVSETLIRDVFATAGEWEREDENGESEE